MAEFIARDVGQPVDLNDPHTLAEYEGFAADVPTVEGMIIAANTTPAPIDANSVRAARLFRPGFLTGLAADANLPTPDPVTPHIEFDRQGLRDAALVVPRTTGGTLTVPMWGFDSNDVEGQWPAPAIRVLEGQVVHTLMNNSSGPHTIHHHGIEPTPANDGVGHLTFEVAGGDYVYQWVAAEAGTYFYHCHRNTVLHFERGMYGGLIIDPPQGPNFVYVANQPTQFQAEALWVVDDIDTRWHGVTGFNYGSGPTLPGSGLAPRRAIGNRDVAIGIQDTGAGKFGDANNAFTLITDPDGDNPRLHDFDPNVFVVTGAPVPVGPNSLEPGGPPFSPSIPRSVDRHQLTQRRVTVSQGGKILVRALNAAYCHTRWKFPQQIEGTVIAADGRTFGKAPWGEGYSEPFSLESIGYEFQLSVARRWDVLLDTANPVSGVPVPPGTYDVEVSVHASVGDGRLVTILLPITVIP